VFLSEQFLDVLLVFSHFNNMIGFKKNMGQSFLEMRTKGLVYDDFVVLCFF